jgi:hypothetical protein
MRHRNGFKIAIIVVGGCVFSALANAQQENTLTPREKADGWQSLFDGKDLNGWHSYREQGPGKDWSVQDGAIMLKKRTTTPTW